jgi:DNA-binding MarR family transcriptional regulator
MSNPLLRMHRALEVLRSTGEREFPLQLAVTFTWVAAHDGCLQSEISKAIAMSPSSVSRCLDWLSDEHRSGKQGLNMIRRERDSIDAKRWRIWLTAKGVQFARLIEHQLEDPNG